MALVAPDISLTRDRAIPKWSAKTRPIASLARPASRTARTETAKCVESIRLHCSFFALALARTNIRILYYSTKKPRCFRAMRFGVISFKLSFVHQFGHYLNIWRAMSMAELYMAIKILSLEGFNGIDQPV